MYYGAIYHGPVSTKCISKYNFQNHVLLFSDPALIYSQILGCHPSFGYMDVPNSLIIH